MLHIEVSMRIAIIIIQLYLDIHGSFTICPWKSMTRLSFTINTTAAANLVMQVQSYQYPWYSPRALEIFPPVHQRGWFSSETYYEVIKSGATHYEVIELSSRFGNRMRIPKPAKLKSHQIPFAHNLLRSRPLVLHTVGQWHCISLY